VGNIIDHGHSQKPIELERGMMGHIMVAREMDTLCSLESGRIDIAQVLTERIGDRETHQ
jgi:hypothetical protein